MVDAAAVEELKQAIAEAPEREPTAPKAPETGGTEPSQMAEVVNFSTLRQRHPNLHPPVIDGLLRRGETCNVIAAPKTGKSWLAYNVGLTIATGGRLFDAFDCEQGRVLLIDNELHPPTIAARVPKVAEAMGIAPDDYAHRVDVLPLRGRGVSLPALGRYVENIEAGEYAAIIADAWYRFIPPGMNENANADVMALYNWIDRYAADTGAAWIVVHHTSKGAQGEKAVTDVGAGAGAQSRAADSHLILRQHEEEGAVVLDAAVRSFPPVAPLTLRWEFPLWRRALTLDTEAPRGDGRGRTNARPRGTARGSRTSSMC